MGYTKSTDALDMQLSLLRWMRTESGAHLIRSFFDVMRTERHAPYEVRLDEDYGPFRSGMSLDMAYVSQAAVGMAQTYTITSHISNLLWKMTKGFHSQPILPQDLPEPHGFVVLEEPLYIYDAGKKMLTIKAFMWVSTRNAVLLYQFSDRDDPYDEMSQFIKENPHCTLATKLEHRLALLHIQPIAWGSILDEKKFWSQEPSGLEQLIDPEILDDQLRIYGWMEVFWDWVKDQIPRRMPAYRAQGRRLEREHVVPRDVKVVDLRVLEPTHPDKAPDYIPEDVLWTHRWRVRRHQRQQWYGAQGTEERHQELIWIEEQVRGPEHLPLIEKDTVYRVRR